MLKKRLCGALLALALVLTLLPTQVFAYLGGTDAALVNPAQADLKQEGTLDGSAIYTLTMQDGHLKFSLAVGGEHAGKSVTASIRSDISFAASVANGVYEQARFTLQTGKSQRSLKIDKMEVIRDFTDLPVAEFDNALTIRYTFSGYGRLDPEIECYVTYYFAELGPGATEGGVSNTAEAPDGHTYALVARATWQTTKDNDNTSQYVFRYFQDYHGFSRMGHGSLIESSAHVKLSRTYQNKTGEIVTTAKSTDITAGLGRTTMGQTYGYGSISEIYSDSYGVDSPFVLADRDRISSINDCSTPIYMTYNVASDCLIAEGDTDVLRDQEGFRGSKSALHVWGFRDVYTKAEAATSSEVKFSDPDRVTIPQDADKLGFYASGDDIVVAAITDTAREATLKSTYGEALYILRGEFAKKSDDSGAYYDFTDRSVALTSTITATWSGTEHFRVRVNEQGQLLGFDTTAHVQYSTPTFKLYSTSESAPEAAQLAFEENVLTLSMAPEHNEVITFVDLPEVECKIDSAQFQPDGDLVLSGKLGLDFLLNCGENSMFVLDKIGYGAETETSGGTTTSSFVQKGISASGEVSTGSLIGLDLAEITAKINTFDGEESYAFSLELNAFDLFETEAQLELKRLNNGRLAPNDLYFFLAMQPGIPIAPPVPTAFLRGGGGGFYGLADTINGDYIAIPPMRLKFTAAGDYVKVVKGRLHITIGPSYLEYAGTNLEFADANVIDEFNMYLRLVGEKRSYQGTEYTGLRAGGGMGITIKVPEDIEVFEIASSVEASMFGALDNYSDPTSAYIQLDSRGSVVGKVKIPKKVGKYEFKVIGGYTLASAGVDFILGGQTAIPVSSGTSLTQVMENGLKNLSIYGGLSHTGNVGTMHWRVFYVLPKHFGGAFHLVKNINEDWSLEDEIKENNWYVTGGNGANTQSLGWPQGEVYALCDENGEQVGLAVMENSLYELPVETGTADGGIALFAAQASSGGCEETFTVNANTAGNYSDLLLKVFPAEGNTVDELRENLAITQDGTALGWVDPQYDSEGNITNIAAINCIEITEDGKDGLLISTGLNNEQSHAIKVEAGCDFTYELTGSAYPTTLDFDLSSNQATSTVKNGRSGKTYAVRYYLDTKADRTGENYFLDMVEGSSPYNYTVPTNGTLAPSGEYYVTAVLVEKVKFTADGEEQETWITVDTKTDDTPIHYQNELEPDAPENVDLKSTGNETLTATWDKVADATGYRVSLYYQDKNNAWQLAGASYELDNADFAADSRITAASETTGGYSLRMAPTVSGEDENGTSDEAPTDTNYMVKVEAYRDDASADGVLSSRYYSAAASSDKTLLPAYTPIALEVVYGDEDQYSITLDETKGYGTLTWNKLPENGYLFKVSAKTGETGIAVKVEPEQGSGSLEINDLGHVTAKDADAMALVENSGRVKLTATKGSDVTTYYLRLILDDVAPVLTLDSDNVAADPNSGKYTVTGMTEPGLTVTLATDENGGTLTATADTKGRFALTGTLTKNSDPAMAETEGFASLLSEVTTQDAAGNAANPAAVVITAQAGNTDAPVTPGSSGGGSYTPGYSVTVEKSEHGTVTVAPKNASAGATVTVTVTPDNGYTLEKLTVTNQSGKELSLTGKGDGKYTFLMPSSKVTVKATFLEDNSVLNFFYDVPSNAYYYEAVKWAIGKGITNGVGDSLFAPNQPCTRAQIVVFLWRAAGSPEPKGTAGFQDVSADSYYGKAVAWAVENGITVGTGADTFSPDEACTRAQAVTLLARALNAKASGKAGFSDVPSSSYYADAVAWAAAAGITNGTSNTTFSPNDVCTRAQIVTFLWRAFQ